MCVNCLQVKAHLYRTDYVSATNSEENRRFFELGIRRVASGIRRVTGGIRRVTGGIRRVASGIRRVAGGIRRVASGIRRVASGICRGIAARQDERNKSKNEDRF